MVLDLSRYFIKWSPLYFKSLINFSLVAGKVDFLCFKMTISGLFFFIIVSSILLIEFVYN